MCLCNPAIIRLIRYVNVFIMDIEFQLIVIQPRSNLFLRKVRVNFFFLHTTLKVYTLLMQFTRVILYFIIGRFKIRVWIAYLVNGSMRSPQTLINFITLRTWGNYSGWNRRYMLKLHRLKINIIKLWRLHVDVYCKQCPSFYFFQNTSVIVAVSR